MSKIVGLIIKPKPVEVKPEKDNKAEKTAENKTDKKEM